MNPKSSEGVTNSIIENNFAFKRHRCLPERGKILVGPGQVVEAEDVIGHTYLPVTHKIVNCRDLTEKFNLDLRSSLHFQVGEHVYKGDVLYGPIGSPKKILRSPVSGLIRSIQGNEIVILTESKDLELNAGYKGRISNITPGLEVEISCCGSLIQGFWANGLSGTGQLSRIGSSNQHRIIDDDLDSNMADRIVFAGVCDEIGVIRKAEKIKLAGLILGTMHFELANEARMAQIPILVADRFGKTGMNSLAFRYLSESQNKQISVISQVDRGVQSITPEMFIPDLNASFLNEDDWAPGLEIGNTVKYFGAPFPGLIGVTKKVNHKGSLKNGVKTGTAEILFENNEYAKVPLRNLIKVSQSETLNS